MGRFIIKHINAIKPQKKVEIVNNINENKEVMTTSEKIAMAQEVLGNNMPTTSKRIKRDKGST